MPSTTQVWPQSTLVEDISARCKVFATVQDEFAFRRTPSDRSVEFGSSLFWQTLPLANECRSCARLQSQPTFPSKLPFDAAGLALNAGNELTDALFKHRLPRHQPKAEPILDHSEASACKRGSASEPAADIFARFAGREGQASLGGHLTTDTLHLALLKICDSLRRDLDGTSF